MVSASQQMAFLFMQSNAGNRLPCWELHATAQDALDDFVDACANMKDIMIERDDAMLVASEPVGSENAGWAVVDGPFTAAQLDAALARCV